MSKISDWTAATSIGATDLVPIVQGGVDKKATGAMLPTRASLGLDTTDAPQFSGVKVGHASDTYIYRLATGIFAIDTSAVRCMQIGGSLRNIGLGSNALDRTTSTGINNFAVGYYAMGFDVITGDYNISIGYQSMVNASSTSYNVAIGRFALSSITTNTSPQIAIGDSALKAVTTGSGNIGIGVSAGKAITSGRDNFILGYEALMTSTDAASCIAIGTNALRASQSAITYNGNQIAIGNNCMGVLTTGYENVGIGTYVMGVATTAYFNVGVGIQTFEALTTGFKNSGVGISALGSCTDAQTCSALGFGAGKGELGYGNTTGDNNTYLGADTTNSSANQRNYQTVIGASVRGVDASNTVTIGRPENEVVYTGILVPGIKDVALNSYTVAQLPAASAALTGARAYVSDATAPTFLGALTGGGAVVCPVFCNGAAWVSG
jgi:hypothetical protein